MMKFFKITFIFLVLPLFAVCQSFEGMITYEMEAHNPMPDQMTDEEFNAEMGGNLKHVMSYYYKEDKYKSVLEETQATVLYEPTEMKIYSYTVGQLEGGWFDAKKGVEIQEIIKLEEIDTILGIPCQAIQVKSELITVTYYYSAKYRVEYEKFKGHKYGFWEAYLKETCGLPLKSVSKMPFFHISLTATDIQEMELDDAIFELPKDIKMQEMETSF